MNVQIKTTRTDFYSCETDITAHSLSFDDASASMHEMNFNRFTQDCT
jgi:hypothetical protein